jgi:hypothetical protein
VGRAHSQDIKGTFIAIVPMNGTPSSRLRPRCTRLEVELDGPGGQATRALTESEFLIHGLPSKPLGASNYLH